MASTNPKTDVNTATMTMTTNTAMRTNCVVGLGALCLALFQRAICELHHVGPAAANLTILAGMLVAGVLAWRIHQPD